MKKNTIKHIRHKPRSSLKRNDHGRYRYTCNSKISRFFYVCRQKVMSEIAIIYESDATATHLSIKIGLQTVIPDNRIGA